MQNQQNKQRIKQWDWRSVQDSKISEEHNQSTEALQGQTFQSVYLKILQDAALCTSCRATQKKRSSSEEIYDQIK